MSSEVQDPGESDIQEHIICQGPPVCLLIDDECVAAQEAGCKWCRRDTYEDGELIHSQDPATIIQ